jgi:hypothetical protein
MSVSQIVKNGELFIKDINMTGNLKINNNVVNFENLNNLNIITEQQNQITLLQNQINSLNLYIQELKNFINVFKESVYIDNNGQEFNYNNLIN